jgi:glycosyltransferase involved in cell wall biosynthesis
MTVAHLVAVPPFVVAGSDQRTSSSPDQAAVEFTVVVPFHNPGATLRRTVEHVAAALYAQNISFEMIAVAGGSHDGSWRTLDGLPWLRVIADAELQDRGAALQFGLAAARGAWVGFIDVDADAEVDPHELIECLHRAREGAGVLV